MAGVYIKSMEMPKVCNNCPFWIFEAEMCRFVDVTPECPLVEVPDHGDLIDRYLLLNNVDTDVYEYKEGV